MIRDFRAVVVVPSAHRHHHTQQYLTQWLLHLWILFTFLVIAGSESGEGSSFSSSQTSTDEVLGTAEARGGLACSFPPRWTGHWFQSGVHHSITITSSSISSKGKCLEVDGEKYLVYHPRSDCYRCLVFSEKHSNVLQYKETFCIQERRSLPSICSTISGDANLYAMFRLDAEPIECPLQGPFTFSYDRGYGECRYPESSLDSCTQPSRLLFNYQACPDVPKTESVEEELQCLAAWKEGSYRYFLGLIQYRHHASSFEDRFRCFAYEVISSSNGASAHTAANMRRGELLSSHHSGHMNHHHHQQQQSYPQTLALGRSRPKPYHGVSMIPTTNNGGMTSGFSGYNNSTGAGSADSLMAAPPPAQVVYRVEQSGDATCNGLSTMEGSRTMFLRKVQPPTTENCQFPSWVQTHPQWHTLDQSLAYEFDRDRFRITNHSASNAPDNLALTASCMQILEDEPGHRAAIVLHSRAACKIGYQCMVVHKRDADILELQFGEWSRKHEEACPIYFDPYVQPYITLISSTPKRAQCPALGKFSFQLYQASLPTATSGTNNNNNLHHQETLCAANGTLRMGCSSLDSLHLEISLPCHDHNHHHPTATAPASSQVTEYKCHGWWEEDDGSTYLLATTLSSSSSSSSKLRPKRHCFVLRDPSVSVDQTAAAPTSPHWMRFKKAGEGQMSLFRHSNGGASSGGQQEQKSGASSRRGAEEDQTSSAALFFFNSNNNNNHAAVGKTLEISRFADSCRRNVTVGREGELAFNATKTGHCLASSSASSSVIFFRAGGSGGRMCTVVRKMMMIMSSVTALPHWVFLPSALLLLLR